MQKLYKRCSVYSLEFYPFQRIGRGKNANVHYSACEREVSVYSIKWGTSGSAPARPFWSCKIITLKRTQTHFCVQGVISLQSMYKRATAHLRAHMTALCSVLSMEIFCGLHPDKSV